MLKIKSRTVVGLFFVIFFFLGAFDKPKLMRVKVNDEITIMVPKEWIPMDGMDFTQRYPSVRAPLAAYTNQERNTDFSVNISATQWSAVRIRRSFLEMMVPEQNGSAWSPRMTFVAAICSSMHRARKR